MLRKVQPVDGLYLISFILRHAYDDKLANYTNQSLLIPKLTAKQNPFFMEGFVIYTAKLSPQAQERDAFGLLK